MRSRPVVALPNVARRAPPIQSGAQRLTQQAVFHVAAIEETVQIAIEAGRFVSWRHVVVSGMKHVVIQTTHPAETRPEFRERFGLELRSSSPLRIAAKSLAQLRSP